MVGERAGGVMKKERAACGGTQAARGFGVGSGEGRAAAAGPPGARGALGREVGETSGACRTRRPIGGIGPGRRGERPGVARLSAAAPVWVLRESVIASAVPEATPGGGWRP